MINWGDNLVVLILFSKGKKPEPARCTWPDLEVCDTTQLMAVFNTTAATWGVNFFSMRWDPVFGTKLKHIFIL